MSRTALHRVWIGAVVWATLLAGSARAEEPTGTEFTYQGCLKLEGVPVTGECDFEFTLWDAATDGTQVGTIESLLTHPVADGLFTALLDFDAGAFDGHARWLEIVVDGETLAPRQKLTASPYALFALGAPWSGLSGIPAGFDDGTDDVGWALTGNLGTDPLTDFLGTRDNLPLVLRVNNEPALRLEPNATSPNLIGGYSENAVTAGAHGAAIGGGGQRADANRVTDSFSTVGGGVGNQAGDAAGSTEDAAYATVGGGEGNTARRLYATVGGGEGNTAAGVHSTVGGGDGNTASAYAATVGGGQNNTASGLWATVPGGAGNTASGLFSFAAGNGARANSKGSFAWADDSSLDFFDVDADYRFAARAAGGVFFYTKSDLSTGAKLPANSGSWVDLSDRNVKADIEAVEPRTVLQKLADVPVSTWRYQGEDEAIRHMGPMAQDLHAAFGLGHDDKGIATIDADGVALAAIQGLHQLVREKDGEIAELKQRLEKLEALVDALTKQGACEPRDRVTREQEGKR